MIVAIGGTAKVRAKELLQLKDGFERGELCTHLVSLMDFAGRKKEVG